jgi:uncharacterized protein (TIGR03437 family)
MNLHWVRTSLLLAPLAAYGQTTTNFTFNLNLTPGGTVAAGHVTAIGQGTLTGIGPVALNMDLSDSEDINNGNALSDFKGVIIFVFDRTDSFDVTVDIPNRTGNPTPVSGSITNGQGAYQGATGSVTFTFTGVSGNTSSALKFSAYSIAASGSVTVAGKSTALTLPATQMLPLGSGTIFRDTGTGTGTVSPLGNVTVILGGHGGDNSSRQNVLLTLSFNSTDSVSVFATFIGDTPPPTFIGVIYGGTGAYAGATGTVTIAVGAGADASSFSLTGSGSITTGGSNVPTITRVSTAFGLNEISPNGWTAIQGKNLVPATTPAAGTNWNSAASFAQGQMPTSLNGVSVTVNGIPAYVNFYCSAATDPSCPTDQINILTPLDSLIAGNTPSAIVVTNGSISSAPFIVDEEAATTPSFLLFSPKGYVVGVHLDSSLMGPASLYPGYSTPAKAGETVILFAVGFGLPAGKVVQSAASQSGALAGKQITCNVGLRSAAVAAAIISPGLAQLNVTIPPATPSGDTLIWCGYQYSNGSTSRTPAGNLIAVQ